MNLSLYLLTVLIWGTTWIAIKLQMGPVAITLSIAYRFALAALVLFFIAGFWPGLSWLVVAFLLSPYGLPMAAAWLVGMIGGVNGTLKDFIFG